MYEYPAFFLLLGCVIGCLAYKFRSYSGDRDLQRESQGDYFFWLALVFAILLIGDIK